MSTFQLLTHGASQEVTFSMSSVFNALEITAPEAQGRLTLVATDLKFGRGQLITGKYFEISNPPLMTRASRMAHSS